MMDGKRFVVVCIKIYLNILGVGKVQGNVFHYKVLCRRLHIICFGCECYDYVFWEYPKSPPLNPEKPMWHPPLTNNATIATIEEREQNFCAINPSQL